MTFSLAFAGSKMDLIWINLFKRNFLSLIENNNEEKYNGPDLYVYLSVGKDTSDIVNLGRLKGNIGNQNYEIPTGTDLSKYNTVLIWCKAFSTLFGSAKLSSQ